ncbi:HIT family protein [Microbacterium gorillae]|uniref:HIT family protein n=1 Tax=Microbacterium gorillae TaxID=1231063 RepID=UPI000B1465FB|nr:HIT domain-containing protein [Microbacterium gorillae]
MRGWWSDDEWMRRQRRAGCGMCADAHLPENEHSLLVATTATVHVRLVRNQAHAGYCVVILRDHMTDLADLDARTLTAFWADVQRTGRTIAAQFAPRKIDYLVMGHRMPHLHCHLLPQHSTDDPLRNVDIADGPLFPSPADLADTLAGVQHAWRAQAEV